jgi:hypothetical protein
LLLRDKKVVSVFVCVFRALPIVMLTHNIMINHRS